MNKFKQITLAIATFLSVALLASPIFVGSFIYWPS